MMELKVEMKNKLQADIAETSEESVCPVIRRLADIVSMHFEYFMEEVDADEDDLVLLNVVTLYGNGMYWSALSMLSLAFYLKDMDEPGDIAATIGSSGDEHCMKVFLAQFLMSFSADLDAMCEMRLNKLN